MDIKNPEYLVEIARQQGVTRAAEKLFVTQSTLSQYLLKMEAELGMPLFSRSQNRLVPTEAGNIYIQAARDILRIQEAAQAGAEALCRRGHIDLGVTSIWGARMMVEIMPLFRQRFPEVTLRLVENRSYLRMKALLKAGEIDLAVMAIRPEDDTPAQGYTHLRNEEIVLALAEDHPFCAAHAGEEAIGRQVLSTELRQEDYPFSGRNSSTRQRGVRAEQQRRGAGDGGPGHRHRPGPRGLRQGHAGGAELPAGPAPAAGGRAGVPQGH